MSKAAHSRPFRFTFGTGMAVASAGELIELAKRVEAAGYSSLVLPDHFSLKVESLAALAALARETNSLRLGTIALANDFRHPAVLARQIATLDVLSDGRAEIGVGAGHTEQEFRQAGIPFDAASVRIGRLEEALIVLKGLLGGGPFSFGGRYYNIDGLELSPAPVQRPRPPLLVGGGGRKLLAVAARHADIIAIAPQAPWGRPVDARMEMLGPAIRAKVDWIREQASDRFSQVEISGRLTAVVTRDRAAGARRCRDLLQAVFPAPGREISEAEILQSPCYAVGTPDQICDHLREVRERYEISHFTLYGTEPEAIAPIVRVLQGC